ncbi:MAG: class I SAM-dependent methyltransferase [Endomicrobium sp.]|nr:class I SAM-dependent methyltransferase [Endomicrobium sp.]
MSSYFNARRVSFEDNFYQSFKIPQYILQEVSCVKDIKILDIGFGPAHFLKAFKNLGYQNVFGVDINENAVKNAIAKGFDIKLIKDLKQYLQNDKNEKFDFIIMSHLIEHLKKEEIIPILKLIYENKLNDNGKLFIATPNAQSLTGSYWHYEDWTHETIFTSGSLYYVLYMAGFRNIKFLDIYALSYLNKFLKPVRFLFFKAYEFYLKNLRNKIFANIYHKPNSIILTWEIKCIAKK